MMKYSYITLPEQVKTCSSISIAELAKKVNPGLRSALVILKGESIRKNFLKELAFSCTAGEYIPPNFESLTEKQKVLRLNKLAGEAYEISTFLLIARQISSKSDEQIIKEYSNRVIIIDEAHNLRLSSNKNLDVDIYYQIHRMLHLVNNRKIILLTATPMRDRPEEFATTMNLILPLNTQLLTGNDFMNKYFRDGKLLPKSSVELRNIIRGRISFLRSAESLLVRYFEGSTVKNYDIKYLHIVQSTMSSHQFKGYQEAYLKDIGSKSIEADLDDIIKEEENTDENQPSLYSDSRQASLFVFPDGTYGREGFKIPKQNDNAKGNFKYITKKEQKLCS